MKKFAVYVPIAGYIYKEVEADTEDEALDIVFDEGYTDNEIQEMEMYEKIVEGNVCHVGISEAYAKEIQK